MPSNSHGQATKMHPLHVAVIMPYRYCPEWQLRLVKRLEDVDGFSISTFGFEDIKNNKTPRRDPFSIWRKLDAAVFVNDSEAAGQRGHEELPRDLSADDHACQYVFQTPEQFADITEEQSFDVILWLLPEPPRRRLLDRATFGVWSLSSVSNDAAGFWEVVDSVPVVSCELFAWESNPERHRLIGRVFAKTDHLSLTRTLRRIRAMDESLVVSKLDEIRRKGELISRLPSAEKRTTTRHGRPGAFRLLGTLSLFYGRYILKVATRQFHRNQWQLAYRMGGDRYSQDGLSRLAPDDKGFWADPFVVRRDDRTVIFFEEYEARTSKGRIVAVEIEADGSIGPMKAVLDCDYHLSYPFLFEFEGSLFMIPESADAGRVEAFRCVDFPYHWESHAVLLEDLRAFDATLVQHDDRWWMFAAVQHNGNTACDELQLFYASGPFEKWTPHPANPISLDIRCARPAGAMYQHDGQLFRPAQDCSVRYGYALSIQRIIRLDVEEYLEETVQQILPDWAEDINGTHTINQSDGITVYDCYVRRRN